MTNAATYTDENRIMVSISAINNNGVRTKFFIDQAGIFFRIEAQVIAMETDKAHYTTASEPILCWPD